MSDTKAALRSLFDPVPPELVEYFDAIADGSLLGFPENEVDLLRLENAIEQTNILREFHPVIQCLGGFILDDPNTSNHHVYLSRPPVAGTILFLDHDGDTRIVFLSLADFLHAALAAKESDHDLSEKHPHGGVLIPDQPGLSTYIRELIDNSDEIDTEGVLLALIPSMDLTDLALLERLANMDDFYIGAAVGDSIAHRPSNLLVSVATTCANHSHFQVQGAGKNALAAIARVSPQD